MVKQRSVAFVVIISLITAGIYWIYWLVKTTLEIKEEGGDAPNPWMLLLFLVPVVNIIAMIYYYWKYAAALETVTKGAANKVLVFVLMLFLSIVGVGYAQYELNKLA